MENCCSNEELKQYEDRVDMSIFNQGPVVIFHWRNKEHWPVEFVTPNAVLVFGYSAADFFEGRIQYAAIIHPDDLERVAAEVTHFSETAAERFQHEDYRIVAKDGTERWVEDHTQIIRDDAGQITHYLGYVLDVSARKKAEETLRESELRFKGIAESMSDWIWEVDAQGVYTYCSGRVEDILGYRPEEIVGRTPFDLMPVDEAERIANIFADIVAKRAPIKNLENWNLAKDGRRVCLETSGIPLLDDEGNLLGYRGVDSDITERKVAEEQLLEAKLSAETASQAKSEFLSRMSHELRTPMNAILGFTELMLEVEEDPLTDNQRESLSIVRGAGRHLLDLINEVLDLAKIDAGKLQLACENVDWRRVLKQSLELTLPSLEKQGLSLVDETSSEGPVMVKADEMRLRQVMLNLLSNAVKYNRPQGSITLRSNVDDAGTLRIEVTDTGEGLTEAQIGELFEPFNRLTHEGSSTEGVGIGLVISKRLMELMGGEIGVQCVSGEGCTFCLELPIASD